MKSMEQLNQWHDRLLAAQELTTRCAFCPDWSFAGTAADGLEAARAHRKQMHPEIPPYKRPRRGAVGKITRSAEDPEQRRRDSARRKQEHLREIEHGTATSYSFGCRCVACKQAWAVYGKAA